MSALRNKVGVWDNSAGLGAGRTGAGGSIVQMQQGLAAYRAMGTEETRLAHLPLLAGAYAQVGQAEEGLALVAEALPLVDKTGMRLLESGLKVLKGWLLLARAGENQVEAETCFR